MTVVRCPHCGLPVVREAAPLPRLRDGLIDESGRVLGLLAGCHLCGPELAAAIGKPGAES